ncbi:helix-turn-helix transcriptional regulator [Corynebacterium provencense]|uniref:helix-turn-helix transcriptional regulator n=1 Tax=Corynebacterium provencense TaxID=1737425 RepID=UPI000834B05B|nr:AraC family transcriptional regulator [Corynebacterium provencense]
MPLPRSADTAAALVHIPSTDLAERVHTGEHLLLWQVRGESDFRLRTPTDSTAEHRQLTAGHALWLPAGVLHSVHVNANSTMIPTFYPVASTATRLSGPVVVPVDPVLQVLILAQLQQTTTAIRPRANISRQVLSLLEDAPKIMDSLPTPTSSPARTIAEAIRFNPGDERTLAELAESVHTSLRTVQRQFTAETGISIRQWRTRVRLTAAAQLLRAGGTLAAVANRVGYADVSSFCRAFKAHHSMTTGEYLRRYGRN